MKSIQEFLSYLSDLDVRLWLDGDHLRCNAPKDILTPALQTELMQRKAEILNFLQKANFASSSAIKPVPREENLPLSFGQQGLWFLDKHEGGSTAYNQLFALRLSGLLNLTVLQQALTEIVRRHEILRTTFKNVDGQPFQAVAPDPNVTMSVVDLLHLPETEQWEEVQQLAIAESQRPFNLAQELLLRVALFQLSNSEHVLLFTIHHMISDAWSSGIIIEELAALYEAFSRGKPSPLPELPIQYADFAYWQRQQLRGTAFEEHLTYWKQQLSGALPVLELPSDRPRPAVQTFRGAATSLKLGSDLTQKLNKLSQQEGATLFITLLASFQALLYRYTNQDDICVGTTIANRHSRDLEQLVGFFVNTVVMRTKLSGNLSFLELLSRVQHVALEAYNHKDLPFDLLVGQLKPERNLSHTPLFQVMFVLENAPINFPEPSGLALSLLEMPVATAKFDLTLTMRQTQQGLIGKFEYNTDLFDAATITRMAGHFQTLLEAIAANPQHRLFDLPLLTETEQHQLLVEWNDTQADYPNQCIHQLFEEQVERTPDAVAVVFEDRQLTYRELNQRANQLARHLNKLGIKPDVLVGICVERSLEMVVGVLGILKAGGAYVPLDPANPPERLAFMLSDARVPVLLTQSLLIEKLPLQSTQVICLDTDWQAIAQQPQSNPNSDVSTDNLVYVIYTSGSTGIPKGAMNTHQGISNRLLWMQDAYQLTPQDRVLQKTPFSFDVSVWEFFWPLLNGARLIVAQPGGHQDTAYLVKLIAREKITTLHFVPSMLQIFLEESGIETLTSIQRVICSGEVLSLELQKRFFARLKAELHNLYGPTEAAIDVTFWQCQRQSNLPFVPIGRAIANTQIYLLDSEGQPVPIGIPGELHIGGEGLARGYLDRPELTAEKFIPHPFSNKPGTHLYKTGDLARYLPNGEIEYIGRIDHQVKIRGFRIELGEIEAVLSQHPQVQTTVVVAWKDKPNSKRLAAYFVPNNNQTPNTTELRNFLKARLPEYMLPSVFVMLEAIPLTSNGKVNRKALPAPDSSRPELAAVFVAPRTPVEIKLAEIWCELLRLEQVGIYDNFFDLGGDSILSIQISHKANQAGLQLTSKQLFDRQTIAELAAVAGTFQPIKAEKERLELDLTFSIPTQQPAGAKKSYTSSDFPQAQLNQKDLDRLIAKINRGGE